MIQKFKSLLSRCRWPWQWVAVIFVAALALSACGPGPTAITSATLRDQIFSIEPRQNGTVTIWMVHDDVGSYCVTDPSLVKEAQTIFHSGDPTAIVSYKTINAGDAAGGGFFGLDYGTVCAQEDQGSSSNHTTYLVTGVEALGDWIIP